jgi:hypothetical protein
MGLIGMQPLIDAGLPYLTLGREVRWFQFHWAMSVC